MKVTATKPWEPIHIDISYIEPNYKSERYQLTATCDYSGAVLTKTLKTRDLLVVIQHLIFTTHIYIS